MFLIITSPNTSNYHHAGGGCAAIHDHTVHRRMGSLDVGHYTAGTAKSTGKDEYHIPHSDPPRRPTTWRLSGRQFASSLHLDLFGAIQTRPRSAAAAC